MTTAQPLSAPFEFSTSSDYIGYHEDHNNNQQPFGGGGGNHSHSSVTLASNDSSMDGVYVYRSTAGGDHKTTPCRFVKGHVFKRTVVAVILLNTILLGVRTYYVPNYSSASSNTDSGGDNDDAMSASASDSSSQSVIYHYLTAANYICLWFFTMEIILKLIHYQQRILWMGWTLVDIAVVVAAWSIGPSVSVLRLTRLKGMFKRISYTQILIKSLVRVLPQVGGILLILLSVFYAFAVILTSFCPKYFVSLGQTMWFLLNLFFLHQWDEMSTDVSNQYPHVWILLLIFTLVTTGLLTSLVIAVMTNAVSQTHREQIDKYLDSDGVSIKKRIVTTPLHAVSSVDMAMMGRMSPPPPPPLSIVMSGSSHHQENETALLLQYCQRLEAKLDDLSRTLERRNVYAKPPVKTNLVTETAGPVVLVPDFETPETRLMNAARAKRESFRLP